MRDQRKAVGWSTSLLLVFLSGCGPPASERCWDIHVADQLGRTSVVNRNHTLEDLWSWRDAIGADSMDRITEKVPMSHVRAVAYWLDVDPGNLATDNLLQYYSDSGKAARAALHLRHDSLVQAPMAPPRPSDMRWYAEHCYRGQPR